MSIANYSDLKTRLAEWVSRSDLSTQIDDAIDLFEAEIVDVLPSSALTSGTVTSTAGTKAVTLPADFLELKGLNSAASPFPLEQISEQYGLTLYGDDQGTPVAFSFTGGTSFKQWPTSGSALTFNVSYVADFTPLSDAATTNWLITNHPHIYLYGALRHLAMYVEDNERKATIEPNYQMFLGKLQASKARRRLASGQAVVRLQGRTP